MSGWLKQYFAYKRAEGPGMVLLSAILLTIILGIWLIRHFVRPVLPAEEALLNRRWQEMTRTATDTTITANTSEELFYFDPNTLDSNGFLRLGLRPKTVHLLLNWRSHGKHFYKKEDLKSLYTLSTAGYERLAPFISIKPIENSAANRYSECFQPSPPLPDKISLNRTDSATLVRIKGIGPALAHKIIERRTVLGGFRQPEQLLELYRFPDTTYTYLKEHLLILPEETRPMGLNTVTEEQMALHPYIGVQMAHYIILLRNGLGKFSHIAQLRQVPLMNEEKYRKIAPYFVID